MYQKRARQISFILPFGGELNPNNRWVQIADLLPWVEIEEKYAKNFRSRRGYPAKSARIAIGALIIKEMLGLSDEGTVEKTDKMKENATPLKESLARKKDALATPGSWRSYNEQAKP